MSDKNSDNFQEDVLSLLHKIAILLENIKSDTNDVAVMARRAKSAQETQDAMLRTSTS